jgi:hypothetical protein
VGFPTGQAHWLRELAAQDWVQAVRADGHRNLMTIARGVSNWAVWATLASRPTWAKLLGGSGLSKTSLARWLRELRLRGWLELIEHGSTPRTRPMSLAGVEGNRAAVYALRIPLTHEQALASGQLVDETAAELTATTGDTAELSPGPSQELDYVEDINVTPSWSCRSLFERSTSGSSRAGKLVDNSDSNPSDQYKQKTTALRAGSDAKKLLDFSIMVAVTRYEMLACAEDLRRRMPVFARCSRKLVRHLCRPLWRAGWCNRDIAWAMDHRPTMFCQLNGHGGGGLISPEYVVSPAQFIRSRLRAWRQSDGRRGEFLPGYWTSRLGSAAADGQAREQVRARHGRAGAGLLRAGERALSARRIAEHGRAARVSRRAAPGRVDAPPDPVVEQHQARAERDRRRSALVAQARAELAASAPEQPTTCPPVRGAGEAAAVAAAGPYERALRRARAEGQAALRRGQRRRW